MIGRRTFVGIFVLILAYYFSRSKTVQKLNGKVVQINSGDLQGIISLTRNGQEFYEWLGIPYGKAERFQTPKPADKWAGVRDAKEYGPVCAQLEMFTMSFIGEEDCLFLNVHAPKDIPKGTKLPVLLFIHGGYFYAGSSNMYRPDYFLDEKVILITINYRLGALGFLNTGDNVVRGNMGLKDQSLALKWTKENIGNFGGDENNIVVFGESAGGASAHYHMFSLMSKGLVSKVISQSGTTLNPWAMYDEPKEQAKEFAQSFNCPTSDSTKMIDCLRKVNLLELVEGHRPGMEIIHAKSKVFVPTIETIIDEETFLHDDPLKLMTSGQFTHIPWMNGFISSEGLISAHHFLKNATFRAHIQENFSDFAESFLVLTPKYIQENGQKIRDYYFGKEGRLDNLDQFQVVTNLIGDAMFGVKGVKASELHAKHAPVYLYYYDHEGPSLFNILLAIENKLPMLMEILISVIKQWVKTNLFGQPAPYYGPCHGDELVMLFMVPDIFHVTKDHPNYNFSKDLVKLWVDFAYDDKTMKFQNQEFSKFEPKESLKFFELTETPGIKNVRLRLKDALTFWNSLETK